MDINHQQKLAMDSETQPTYTQAFTQMYEQIAAKSKEITELSSNILRLQEVFQNNQKILSQQQIKMSQLYSNQQMILNSRKNIQQKTTNIQQYQNQTMGYLQKLQTEIEQAYDKSMQNQLILRDVELKAKQNSQMIPKIRDNINNTRQMSKNLMQFGPLLEEFKKSEKKSDDNFKQQIVELTELFKKLGAQKAKESFELGEWKSKFQSKYSQMKEQIKSLQQWKNDHGSKLQA